MAATGAEALEMARPPRHDLLLLDVMLPDLDGNEVCRRLRALGVDTPDRLSDSEGGDRGQGHGPDSRRRRLRHETVQPRRARGEDPRDPSTHRPARSATASTEMSFEDLVIDEEAHEVWRQGELVELTATEFNLLRYLLVNARRVVSKSEILDNVWDYDFEGDPSIVETYISYLRKKIDRFSPPLIQTVRGVGYSMRLARETGS